MTKSSTINRSHRRTTRQLGLMLLLSFAFLLPTALSAQVSSYSFVESTETYTAVTGTTSTATGDDATQNGIPIGFTFMYGGVPCTHFSLTTNGFIKLGTSSAVTIVGATSAFQNSNFGLNTDAPLIAPFWDDNNLNTGTIKYALAGTPGSQTLEVGWNASNIGGSGSTSSTNTASFKVRLYEGTNVIEFVYGTMNTAGTLSASIGLEQGGTYLAVTPGSPSTVSNTALNNTISSSTALVGKKFTFTPPAPCPVPTALAASINLTPQTVATISGSFTAAPPTAPTGYLVVRTTTNVQPAVVNGIAYTVGPNPIGYIEYVGTSAGSWTSTSLTANTAYYYWVFSYNNNLSCVGVNYSATATAASAFTPACAFPPGTYTVGATGTLANLTTVVANLTACAQNGAYVFELLSDYNPASETYPITFPNLAISSAANTVTVRPALGSTASITSANTSGTLRLDGMDWLILDGRPGGTGIPKTLVVENTSTSGYAIQLINDATNNRIQYATVRSANTGTSSGTIFFSTTTGTSGNDNNTIDNCDIKDGATLPLNGIFSSGSTTTAATNNSGNTVSNSNIYNFFNASSASNGISIVSGNTDWTINANHFYQTATRTGTSGSTHTAINISNTSGNNFVVTNNYIGGSTTNAGGTPWTVGGSTTNRFIAINLSVGTTTASSVQGNTIANFSWTSNSGAATLPAVWAGIYLPNGSANIGTTTGNTIGSTTGTGSISVTSSTTAAMSVGIGSTATGVVNISGNSIGSINTAGSGVTISSGFNAIWNTGAATSLTINNNVIGSATTANSINALTASTSTSAQSISGIFNSAGVTTLAITNNTIANINNAYVPSSASSSSIIRGIVNSSGSGVISGNTIRNLTTAANATGTTTGASVIGISQSSTTAPMSITQNTIYGLSNANSGANAVQVIGIYSNGPSSSSIVSRNNVHSLSTNSTSATAEIRGISIAGGTATYQNNMVRLGIDASGASVSSGVITTGIYDVSGTNNLYHNTVYVGGTGVAGSANTYAFRSDVTTNTRAFVNNIFINARSNGAGTGKHYAVRLAGTATNPAGLTSNYNIYQATGTGGIFGFFNSADVANLPAWQTATGKDANSIYADPCLANPTIATPDLHLTNCAGAGSPANGVGTLIATVTVDFDNETRSSLTPTDIGADAGLYGPSGLDLVASALAAPTPTGCKGPAEVVSVSILNNSSNPIDFSVNNATVSVTATGGYTSSIVLNTGTLAAGASQIVVLPATINMVASGSYTFNGNVNVAGDANATNDAFAATTITNLAMGGAYTVGVGGNYTTLTAAVADYNNTTCITAPIIFNLTDATYPSETFPISINNNAQASSILTLTIKPNTAATTLLTGANATSLITLNGARYVTIDGSNNGSTSQNLTIRNKSVAPAIVFINDAVNDAVKNSIIEGINTSTSSGIIVFGTSTGTLGNSNNLISGNNIHERADSTIIPANIIYSSGTGTALNANNTISGNNIYNYTNIGVAVTGTGVGDNWVISGNSLYQTSPRTTTITGISVLGGKNGHTISNNFFGGSQPTATGANTQITQNYLGIVVAAGTGTATNIQGNTIKNIRSTYAAFLQTSYAINLTSGLANISNNTIGSSNVAEKIEVNGDNRIIYSISSAATVIDNNTIINVGTSTTTTPGTGQWVYGIFIEGAGNQTVSNNTITNFTNGSRPDASFNAETRGIYVIGTGAITVRGNNLYNYGSTAAAANPTTAKTYIVWGIHVNAATAAATVIEKNKISDLYGTSPTTGVWSDLILGIQTSANCNGTISNNMINLNGGSNPSDRSIYALYETSGATMNYYFNTVNVYGTATGGTNPTYAFVRNATSTVTIKNNLFSNQRTGGTGFHVAMGNAVAATNWSASASDYNNVYNVDNTHVTQWLGIAAANNRTLAAFRTSSGGDLNSKNVSPVYASATDLHLQVVAANSPLVDAGVAISGITTDIDNAVRSTIPDIGADEFADRPATPAVPTQDVTPPSCTGGTLLYAGTPPSGILWFWQTTATDTSMTFPSTTPYNALTNGVYYLRAYNPTLMLWSLNSSSITVSNVPVAVLPPSPVATTPSCLSTTITVAASTNPDVTYYWQGTNSLGTSTAQNASTPLTVTSSNTYYVAAYDASSNCWSNTNGIAVVVDPVVPAAPSVGANIARCQGAASAPITGLAPGSTTLTWWDASTNGTQVGTGSPLQTIGTSLLPNSNTPGVYTFYAQSNSVACTSATRVPVTVTINALPNVDAGAAHSVCPGYTTLSGSGATTYTWNNGVTNGVSFVINNTTTYTVTGTDGNGCINQDTITLFVLPATPVDIVPAAPVVTCQNQPVVLTANGPAAGPQTIITQWNFNADNTVPSIGTGTAATIGGITPSFVTGSGSSDAGLPNRAWTANGFPAQGTAPKTAGVQFNVSTAGYSGVKFKFDSQFSNTAANTLVLQYNPDVTNGLSPWISVQSIVTTTGGSFINNREFDLSAIPAANNNPNLGIRLVTDTSGGTGNYVAVNAPSSNYGTAGTMRYDMVTFSGQPATATYLWNPGGATTSTYTPNTVGTYYYRVTVTEPGVCPGVDSVLVTVNPIFTTTINPIICGNQTYPIFGQGTVNQTGIYTENRTSVKGCDSTVIVNLTVNPVYNNTIPNVTICSNQTYTLANGNVVSAAGTYTRTVPTIKGCDSTVTVTILVKPAQLINVSQAICTGSSYTLPNGTSVSTAGTYTNTFPAANGCDSTIVTTITLKPVFTSTQNPVICQGQTHTMPNGTTQATAGTYVFPYTAVNGCDSTITVNLTVNPVYTTNVAIDLCPNENYTLANGTVINTPGTHTVVVNTINGCDSTVIVTATGRLNYAVTATASICQGSSYTLVNGTQVTAAGTYVSGTQSIYGCDSVVTITLSINPAYNQAVAASICQGETYTFPDGTSGTSASVHTSHLTSSKGCDSTIVTTLTVNPLPNVNLGSNIAVNNPPVTLNAGVGFSSYDWNTGATTQTIVVTQNGTYSVTVTNQFGCEATDEIQVNFLTAVTELGKNGGNINLFPNPTADRFSINVNGYVDGGDLRIDIVNAVGQVVSTEMVNNATESFTKEFDVASLATGSYTLRVKGVNGEANLRFVIAR